MAFITTAAMIGAGAKAVGGLAKLGMSLSGRGKRIAEQKQAKAEMDAMKEEYRSLDTSNPYANLQNTAEDLTVNQQQAQFQAQQGQQQRANIMQNLQGAAGGSGIAGLAQAMANQGQLASQKASASIGNQESANQRMAAQQAAGNQLQEAQGEARSQDLQAQKTSTLLGMSQQRLGAANQARAEAKAAQMSAVGDIAGAAGDLVGGMGKLKASATGSTGGSVGGLGLEGGGFTDPGFGAKITGGITGPTIDPLTGKPKFKDLSNLTIQ